MLAIVLSLHLLFNSQKPKTMPSGGKTMLTTTKHNPAYFKFAKISPVFWPRPLNHAEVSSGDLFPHYGGNNNVNLDDAFVNLAAVQQGSNNTTIVAPPPHISSIGRPAYMSVTMV
jgi:hypothetical protein